MRRALFFVWAIIISGFCWTEDADAYAWMIRHDYTACSTCHTDPSGGELLTTYGRVTSDLILSMQYGTSDEVDEPDDESSEADFGGPTGGLFWGLVDLPSSLLLSGAYRSLSVIRPSKDAASTFIPVMQADAYGQFRAGDFTVGGSIGLGKAIPGASHTLKAQVTTNTDGLNLVARNYYAGYDLGSEFVVRAGRLNLPFGVRIPEHTAWVREATRTDRESDQQHGLSVAYVGANFRAEIMAIAGNFQMSLKPELPYQNFKSNAVRERGYSMYAEGIAGTSFAAGVTSKVTFSQLDHVTFEEDSLRQAHGLTARYAPFEKLSFLGETDVLFRTNADAGYVGFAQADWEPIQGLHLMLTGEFLDAGMEFEDGAQQEPKPGAGKARGGGWLSLDWFFYRQMEFRTDLILRQDAPTTILGQFHMYL